MINASSTELLTQSSCALPAKGYWFPPTFLTGVTHVHCVASEETFGPVLSVMTFRTPEEAFERANNIPYGLSAGVWTDNVIFKMVNPALARKSGTRRRRLGEHLQQVRPDESIRRRQGKRLRSRRRIAGAGGGLPVGLSWLSCV